MEFAKNAADLGVAMISQWKPIKPEVFAEAIHRYSVYQADKNGHGNLTQTSYKMDSDAVCTIYSLPKTVNSSVRMSVLLSMRYAKGGKMVYFASLKNGDLIGD